MCFYLFYSSLIFSLLTYSVVLIVARLLLLLILNNARVMCCVVCLRRRLIFLISGYTSHALFYILLFFLALIITQCGGEYLCALLTLLAIWGRLGLQLEILAWLAAGLDDCIALVYCAGAAAQQQQQRGLPYFCWQILVIMGEEDHSVHDPSLSSFISHLSLSKV